MKRGAILLSMMVAALLLSGCTSLGWGRWGIDALFSFPVTENDTPYSQCLEELSGLRGDNLPTIAVGEIADKTGQFNYNDNGHPLTQGASEMVISALYKTGKVHLVERLDLRAPLTEVKLAEQGRLSHGLEDYAVLPASDYVVTGAITELNYNIVSGGTVLSILGIGGGPRMVVINVAMDLRIINSRTFAIDYVTSLQKQIYGYEVDANVFRFFGDTLVKFDAGEIKNEPLQLGVRSIAEMSVYQIMTGFLKLPASPRCGLVHTTHMADQLDKISPEEKPKNDTIL